MTERPIAHRGLHNAKEGRPENTLAAAEAALDANYAIECDVRLSGDEKVMVFHDKGLDRLTGQSGQFADLSKDRLQELKVLGSNEGVASLARLLSLINGRMPLVIELKSDGEGADRLAPAIVEVLRNAPGNIALMSFSHDQLRQLRQLLPDRPTGLVATGQTTQDLARHCQMIDAVDFVSFNVDELDNPFCAEVRERNLPLVCWTVRSADQARRAYRYCDQITFEGFRP
nr:glycerophosphodiester phosphodiesterase family protein [Notoacmeibacter sp. MSK16QG-6]